MAAADVLQEMLLQTHRGLIRVFPAIPARWATEGAEFSRFRGERGVLVSSRIEHGHVQAIELYAERSGDWSVYNAFAEGVLMMETDDGTPAHFIHCPANSCFPIRLSTGLSYTIIAAGT
jgi:hypothetical protein